MPATKTKPVEGEIFEGEIVDEAEEAAALAIAVQESKLPDMPASYMAQITEAQREFLLQKTPRREIKQRVGRGGGKFSYVEHGYVTERLNLIFQFAWDFEVLSREKFDDEVMVEGKLTVYFPNGRAISKTQFGGADIERYKTGDKSGRPLSIADNYKAAASDALKKCASLLGIGLDVYGRENYGDLDHEANSPQAAAPAPAPKKVASKVAAPEEDGEEASGWTLLQQFMSKHLRKIGAAEALVASLSKLVRVDLEAAGELENADSLRAMAKTVQGWGTTKDAVTYLNQLVKTHS